MKPSIDGLIRVNVYKLVSDGIEAPIRFGINRAFKHSERGLTSEEVYRLEDTISQELLNWICETFRFDEENDGD